MAYFREATPSDYEAICKLVPTEQELFLVYPRGTYPLTVDQIKHLSEVRKELTVAIDGQDIVGFADLYDFDDRASAFIGNVVIDRSFRGRGIGKVLVIHMRNTAFSKYGLKEVHISVFSDNVPALLLYAKLGFMPYSIEERRNHNDQTVALIHMKTVAAITSEP